MNLHINREKLISTKGQNLNLSFSGYEISAEAKPKLEKEIIEAILNIYKENDNENT